MSQTPQLNIRGIAGLALNLYLSGRVSHAARLYEMIVVAAATITPSLEKRVCGMISRLLEERFDIKLDDCRLYKLRQQLEEALRPRLPELVQGYENMTPPEREEALRRIVDEAICEIGLVLSRFLQLS